MLYLLKNSWYLRESLNILTRFYERLQDPSSESVVPNFLKDPHIYMYLSANLHLTVFPPQLQTFALKSIN